MSLRALQPEIIAIEESIPPNQIELNTRLKNKLL